MGTVGWSQDPAVFCEAARLLASEVLPVRDVIALVQQNCGAQVHALWMEGRRLHIEKTLSEFEL